MQKSDTICLIGNGLGDRMQHDGWVETVLQNELPDLELRFRNLSFIGDTVTSRPRCENFMPSEDYLDHCKADVIFVLFGYNESFAGEAGVPSFKKDLGDMIEKYRSLKFNGESASRFVLFSPIAHQNLMSPNLLDGAANDRNLALHTSAISEVATEKGVVFLDLFNPTLELYAETKTTLTFNGIHLLLDGRQAARRGHRFRRNRQAFDDC